MSSEMFVPEEGLSSLHLRSELNSITTFDGVFWEFNALGRQGPGEVLLVSTSPESKVSVLVVVTSMYCKAVSTIVSEVSVWSIEVEVSLGCVTNNVLSCNSNVANE